MKIPLELFEEITRQMEGKLSKGKVENSRCLISKDVLFFPRQKLMMHREKRPYHYKKALFIERKINEFSTRLEEPTEKSGEALMSGLRSAITLDKNKGYIKMKGVNAIIKRAGGRDYGYGMYYGLCGLQEALMENVYIDLLKKKYNFIAANSGFTELHAFDGDIDPHLKLLGKSIYSKTSRPNLNKTGRLINKMDGRLTAISGLEIKADTRLDEVIYHLTRGGLKGHRERARDNILHYLCFSAGISKACLTLAGHTWGQMLENTNCHLGNFVIGSDYKDVIDVGIIDIYSLKCRNEFRTGEGFLDFSDSEVDSFKWDFDESVTASFPLQRRYKHFSRKLRGECFKAIKTGYFLALAIMNYDGLVPKKKLDEYILPKICTLPTEEFRYEIKRLTR